MQSEVVSFGEQAACRRKLTSKIYYELESEKSSCKKVEYSYLERLRLSEWLIEHLRYLDICKRRDMTLVKEAYVTKVDRFLEKHRGRYQTPVDVVPTSPHIAPFVDAGQTKGRPILGPCDDGRK